MSPAVLQRGDVERLIGACAVALLARQKEINDLNVFPVPDGDTGTNMYLTMKSVLEHLESERPASMAELAKVVTHAALLGARGNSGVILSQIVRGFFDVAGRKEELGPRDIVEALESATEVAYRAVRKPVEGTMLTVVRDMAQAARKLRRRRNLTLDQLFEAVVDAAEASVRKTPELLAVLKSAGVVDAGGFGLLVMARGALAGLRGEEPEVAAEEALAAAAAGGEEEITFTYCTELLVDAAAVPVAAAERFLEGLGDSILVVSDGTNTRVHVHTDEPGTVLAYFQQYGQLVDVRVNNMRRQAEDRTARLSKEQVSAVVVSNGPGLNEIFRSLGAARVVNGGDTLNPSTKEILAAIEEAPSDTVVFLPNNKNIVMAGEQAARMTSKEVVVVPSRTVQQGLAAMLVFDPSQERDRLVERMNRMLASVVSVGVTRAVRDSSVDGRAIREGDYLGIVDERIVANGADLEGVLREALAAAVAPEHSIVTVFFGKDLGEDRRAAVVDAIASWFPELEVDAKDGGQSHYELLLSVE